MRLRLLSLLLVSGLSASAGAPDLDVGIPPGTPLEWNREFRQPVPTGNRGRVPVASKGVEEGPARATVVKEPESNLDFVVSNLYDYFRVTTVDIMLHVSITLPKSTGKVSQDDVATGGGLVMTWNYPPQIPSELVWMGAMASIREQVHPEVVSWPESAAYCLELGTPSLHGAKAYDVGKISGYLKKQLKPLPAQLPQIGRMKDPEQAVYLRLAAVELSGGFPHALDPAFARRTLGLGNDAYLAVLECTQNANPLLARNAVAVLAHFPRPEAGDELVKRFRESKDPVVRVRALTGLLRRRGAQPLVPDLIKWVQDDKDEPMQALAMHALGLIGDPAAAPEIRKAAAKAEPDVLWSAIPALARIGDGSKETHDLLVAIERLTAKKFKGLDDIKVAPSADTPSAEEHGAKWKVLHQMAVIALARAGDKTHAGEVKRRALTGFHPATHYLLIETLGGMGDEGAKLLKERVLDPIAGEDIVRMEALRQLAAGTKIDAKALAALATGTKGASVRALALQLLMEVDEAEAKAVAAKLVADYAAGAGEIKPDDAFVVAAAAQVGGRLGALAVADLRQAVVRAWDNNAYARREGKNELDITKAEIKVHPALLESLVVELGRTGDAAAAEALIPILRKPKAAQGRAEAALALGAVGGKDAVDALTKSLDDTDGWVRFCAYRSLKKLSTQDHFCDWIFGDKSHRAKAADAYREWAKGK